MNCVFGGFFSIKLLIRYCQLLQNHLQINGWRDGRVAEGDGLLNRYRAKSSIGGSNPPLSAIFIFMTKSDNG
jgi:hypothetical protein